MRYSPEDGTETTMTSHDTGKQTGGKPAEPQAKPTRSDCERPPEELLDDAHDDSFPASDPPAIVHPSHRRC